MSDRKTTGTQGRIALRLRAAAAGAVAVEWSDAPPSPDGADWRPCRPHPDGSWRPLRPETQAAAFPVDAMVRAVRYRLSPAGGWSAVAAPGAEVAIVAAGAEEGPAAGLAGPPASPSAGSPEASAPAPSPVSSLVPGLVLAPTLLGAAEIGSELSVDPGLGSGAPGLPPGLAFQWRRDGAEIPGAVARAYLIAPQDDGCAFACTVTASSRAGTASATTRPVRAAYPPPKAVAALPEEVFDEGGGAEAVETAFAFRGANLVFALAEAPAGAAIDGASGVLRLPVDRPVAAARAVVVARNSGGAAMAEMLYTVEAAPAPPPPRPRAAEAAGPLPPPTPAMLAEAMSFGFLNYDEAAFGTTANHRPKTVHNITVVALGALAGSPVRVGGRTPAQYLYEQFVAWTRSELPSARGGVSGQRDFPVLCAAALGKRTPAVWGRLTPAERRKIDRVVEGLLVSFAWQMADANPFVSGALDGPESTIRGGDWGRGRVPNFSLPAMLGPVIAADYLGGPAAAQAFLDGFDRAAFAEALREADADPPGSLATLRATFDRDWEGQGRRRGPTAAELAAGVRDFAYEGRTLAQPTEIAARALARMWAGRIRPGIELGPDSRIPKGYAYPPAGVIGIFEPAAIPEAPNRAPGRDAYVGRIFDLADWVRWEEAGLADQEGAATELFTWDGGDLRAGSGSGPRSAMSYAYEGASVMLTGLATLAACGLIDRADPDLRAGLARQDRGAADLRLRNRYGHRSFAKGGRPWTGRGTNEDWDGAMVEEWKLGLIDDLWTEVLKPWSG